MFACCHVSFRGISVGDIDYGTEQIGFPMLPSEIPTDNVVIIREVGFALLAPENLARTEVDIICETHDYFVLPPVDSFVWIASRGDGDVDKWDAKEERSDIVKNRPIS